jgi:hypothetical protein
MFRICNQIRHTDDFRKTLLNIASPALLISNCGKEKRSAKILFD